MDVEGEPILDEFGYPVQGDPIVLDNAWQAACRVTFGRVGGPIISEPLMTITPEAALGQIDTNQPGWSTGIFYYDVRITNPEGGDEWTAPIQLTVTARNAPPSL